MSDPAGVGLPEALERAATALPDHADEIRPANGDPVLLASALPAEAAARVLEWLLENEAADGAELANAWVEDPEAGSAALQQVHEESLSKAARKLLRRVRHRMRARGLDVPETQPASVVGILPPVADRLEEALVSALDGRGARVAYIVESDPAGGARVFEVVLDEQRGLIDCDAYSAGRSKVRRFLKELTQRSQFVAVAAPTEAVRALVSRTAAAQPKDRPLPRAYTEWRSRLSAASDAAATPGELVRAAHAAELGEASGREERLERAARLVQDHELGPWPPEGEVLKKGAERIGEAGEGRIVVSDLRQQDHSESVLAEVLAEVFAADYAEQTARRFEESAFVFWKAERSEDALACLEAARGLREGEPAEQPVARALLEVQLGPALAQQKAEKNEEEQSLLVTP